MRASAVDSEILEDKCVRGRKDRVAEGARQSVSDRTQAADTQS